MARLSAAHVECTNRGWQFSAIQIAGSTSEHPWGDVAVPDYVSTLTAYQAGGRPELAAPAKLDDMLTKLNPDVVAVPGWGFDFARMSLRWVRANGKVSVVMSESKADDSPRRWFKELAKKLMYVRHFSAALVGGGRHREYICQLGMAPDSVFQGYDVVDNGYFIRETDRLRSEGKFDLGPSAPAGLFFLSSNRFIPRKNLHFLIRAYAQYRQAVTPQHCHDLVLLGDGEERSQLEGLVEELGLQDSVYFPGFVEYGQICHWYAAASVFIHPAYAEQWGLVVNEAMAAALPTVVSRTCGCMPDLMQEGKTGFSFDPQNADELVERLVFLSESEEVRTDLGRAGRALVEETHAPQAFGQGLASAVKFAVSNK